MPLDIARIEREIEAGLPHEQARLLGALTNSDYLAGANERYIPMRPSESLYDFDMRVKVTSQITQRVIEVLCDHLYNPGPSRALENGPAVDAWLQAVYADCHANALLHEADVSSTLNDVSMLQVAATGVDARPIGLTLWDSSQFHVFMDPDDACRVEAVVLIDRYNERTRYSLWLADQIRVYLTQELRPGQTAGGRVATLASVEPNPYGFLPFAFFPYSLQAREWWTPGPGTPLRKLNATLDIRLSAIDEAASKHLNPVGIAINVDEAWRPILRPGDFLRLPAAIDRTTDQSAPPPDLKFLQAVLDLEGHWHHLNSSIDHALECFGVPASAVRLDQSGTASGFRVVAEQAPLLGRAKRRQPLWGIAETRLASVVLGVGAYSLGRADLAAAAADPHLTLTWPTPSLDLPGPDRDASDRNEIDMGIASPVDILMRRRGISRAQAEAAIDQVAKDRARLTLPGPASADPVTPAASPPAAAPHTPDATHV